MNDQRFKAIGFIIILLCFMAGIMKKFNEKDSFTSFVNNYERPVVEWVKKNTPPDARFIIPIYFYWWQGTRRDAFYDVNIINGASYNKQFIMEAIKRFQIQMGINLKEMDLTGIPPMEINTRWNADSELKKLYDSLPPERIQLIKSQYGAGYFLTASKKKYNFPVLFKNEIYTLYRL
ncbi:MAG: hypothetical protein A2W19_05450 [Spirochaetes bacterium RBG_16_49_21]|nr:MAG: hypothetical protein A2W19_05450 [Spirochaetes bacterium RBG_16_49_21]